MYTVDAAASLTDSVLLRLGALLHDIGKPRSCTVSPDGKRHFHKHEVIGASIAYEITQDLRFSKKDTEYIVALVRHHQWRFEENSRDKTIRRWLQTVGKDVWEDLITLRAADRKGNLAKQGKDIVTSHMRQLMERARNIINSGVPLFREDLAINGADIRAIGVKPGPIYKKIFSNMLGIVGAQPSRNTKEWLTEYVRRNYVSQD
jgi:tRNA nucleotidyltransferase (CCA-adding enzyme)